jgi:uncharacterized protein (TIGR02145 family)
LTGHATKRTFDGLQPGVHKFNLRLSNKGLYVVKAIFGDEMLSTKLISSGSALGNNEIVYSFKDDVGVEHAGHKSGLEPGLFWYEPGDTLWYVGYAKTPLWIAGSDVIENSPIHDTLIRLDIIEGLPCSGTVAVKHGGQLYPTVQIDDQCWLKENMNLGVMVHGDTNMTDNGIVEKYCYDNDINNCDTYGGLYQWNELMQYEDYDGAQGICPKGWHVSTYEELSALADAHSGNDIKEWGTRHWHPGNTGNNSTGFTALPSGYRGWNSGTWEMIGEGCGFFSSTTYEVDARYAWDKTLYYASSWIVGGNSWKTSGKNVRCVKD